MSITSDVPPAVPSLFHNSWPLAGVKAVKYSVEPTAVRLVGDELLESA
jgi:hypothetical protein